ncbi:hypothetical protein E2C01_082672 [Portunus trituberculatus]|uniref:Uncharacterized protein n=1 Tax=Portunus trituberculatus TaxID=210409 RepID=A0A5B7J4E5_PORTR|nr:hypothetical protein [Portunus trituberculatus]
MLQELTSSLYVRPNKPHVLWELTRCISSAVNADGCNLYLADLDTNTLRRYIESKDGIGKRVRLRLHLCLMRY